ncbi:MAG: Na(+)-translocating NADH-quinone reductase subunit C [Planctomycetota bacterium]
MANNDTIPKTLLVSFLLCGVCSLLVSVAAVSLKAAQERNKALDKKESVLRVAGLIAEDQSPSADEIEKLYDEKVQVVAVDLATGDAVADYDVAKYDAKKLSRDLEASVEIPKDDDTGGIKRRPKVALAYLVRDAQQKLQVAILDVRGKGLWSTMWAFLALEGDLTTVKGIKFYEHGETPGLGGEVDNPNWRKLWPGKKLYDAEGKMQIEVIKGVAPKDSPNEIDGLSGATITSRGVTELIKYWLGAHAYGPYLKKLKALDTPQGESGGLNG